MNKKIFILIGALTSKPYAFTARPWELKGIETIDLFESLNSNIRVDIRGSDVMRILPVNNEIINEEWISDKTRYAYDGLKRSRFLNPMIKKNNFFIQTSWKEVFSELTNIITTKQFDNCIIETGNFIDLEHLVTLDKFSKNFINVKKNPNLLFNGDFQNHYLMNPMSLKIKGQKVFLLVGINLKIENPILNIKLRKLSLQNNVLIGYIGSKFDSTINMIHLGNNIKVLKSIIEGKHSFSNTIQNFLKKDNKNFKIKNFFKNPVSVIFGNEFIQDSNSSFYLETFKSIINSSIKFEWNVLHLHSGTINALELGFFNSKSNIKRNYQNFVYLSNIDTAKNISKNDFVLFQGHHNEKLRTQFNIILPSVTWLEKSSIYINCFGMLQKTQFIIYPPINTRNDWKITIMINNIFKNAFMFNNINEVHKNLNQLSPNIINNISNFKENNKFCFDLKKNKNFVIKNKFFYTPFTSLISNYYQTNSIEKVSKIMKNCSENLNKKKNNFSKN